MNYLEGCSFCECLKQSIRNNISYDKELKRKYSAVLVEENYDLKDNYKYSLRFGGHDLIYCPTCGKKLNIPRMYEQIKHDLELFRDKD